MKFFLATLKFHMRKLKYFRNIHFSIKNQNDLKNISLTVKFVFAFKPFCWKNKKVCLNVSIMKEKSWHYKNKISIFIDDLTSAVCASSPVVRDDVPYVTVTSLEQCGSWSHRGERKLMSGSWKQNREKSRRRVKERRRRRRRARSRAVAGM